MYRMPFYCTEYNADSPNFWSRDHKRYIRHAVDASDMDFWFVHKRYIRHAIDASDIYFSFVCRRFSVSPGFTVIKRGAE